MTFTSLLRFAVAVGFVTPAILPSVASADEKAIKLVPRWKKGETHQYVRTKTRTTTNEGRTLVGAKGSTDVTIEVLEAGREGYLLGWKFGETTTDDPRVAGSPLLKRISNLVKGIQFQLKLDSKGAFKGVKNVEQLKKQFTGVIDFVVTAGKKEGVSDAQLKRIRAGVEAMLLSKQGIEGVMVKEPRIFLMAFGGEFSESHVLTGQSELQLPIGGLKVAAVVEYRVKSFDKSKDRLVISYTQRIDPKEGAAKITEMLKKLAAKMGSPAPKGDPLKNLNIVDTAELEFEVSTGWPLRVEHSRTVQLPGRMQRDVITIRRKK